MEKNLTKSSHLSLNRDNSRNNYVNEIIKMNSLKDTNTPTLIK